MTSFAPSRYEWGWSWQKVGCRDAGHCDRRMEQRRILIRPGENGWRITANDATALHRASSRQRTRRRRRSRMSEAAVATAQNHYWRSACTIFARQRKQRSR